MGGGGGGGGGKGGIYTIPLKHQSQQQQTFYF